MDLRHCMSSPCRSTRHCTTSFRTRKRRKSRGLQGRRGTRKRRRPFVTTHGWGKFFYQSIICDFAIVFASSALFQMSLLQIRLQSSLWHLRLCNRLCGTCAFLNAFAAFALWQYYVRHLQALAIVFAKFELIVCKDCFIAGISWSWEKMEKNTFLIV